MACSRAISSDSKICSVSSYDAARAVSACGLATGRSVVAVLALHEVAQVGEVRLLRDHAGSTCLGVKWLRHLTFTRSGYTDDERVSVMPPLEEQVTRGGKELVPVKGVKVAQVA